jgi:hypothetical protein
MTSTASQPRPAARTALEVLELYPSLVAGVSVIVYTDWSRDRVERVVAKRGTVVRAARNGYVTVLEQPYGCTCNYDPRDLELTPACDMADGCGAGVGVACEPGCPSLATG